MTNWKFKNIEPVGSGSGFWYDLSIGGYICPENILSDEKEIEMVKNAINTLRSFEQALIDNDLLAEF